MLTEYILRIGRHLPPQINSAARPAYNYLNNIEMYINYLVKRNHSDKVVETEYGFQLKIDTSDYVQSRYIHQEGEDEKSLTDFFHKKMEDLEYTGDFIDIGSNVGLYSLIFLQTNEESVFGFEPLCYNVKKFQENMILNGVSNSVVFPFGLSSKRHLGKLYYPPFNKGAGGEVRGNNVPDFLLKSEKAIFNKLDSVNISSNNISVIKIDVEGHELDVIRGAEKFISQHKPDMMIEIHHSRLKEKGQSAEELISYLFDIGYKKVHLVDDSVDIKKGDAGNSISRVNDNHGIWCEA